MKAAARRRVALATALRSGERRDPLTVITDAVHVVDTAAQRMIDALDDGDQPTPEMISALVQAAKDAAMMARLAIDAGAEPVNMARLSGRLAPQMLAVFTRVIEGLVVELGLDGAAVAQVAARLLEAEVRAFLAEAAGAAGRLGSSPRALPRGSS